MFFYLIRIEKTFSMPNIWRYNEWLIGHMMLADSKNGDKEAGKQKVQIKIDILSTGIYLLI